MMYSKVNCDTHTWYSLSKFQYLFKLKANATYFALLLLVQAVMLLFSLNGIGGSSRGGTMVDITEQIYSGYLVLIGTIIVVATFAVSLASQTNRRFDFAFVSSRLTGNIASIGVLVTFCIYAGITGTMASYVLRMYLYLNSQGISAIVVTEMYTPLSMLFIGILSYVLYLILAAALVYLIGSLNCLNRLAAVGFSILLIAGFFLLLSNGNTRPTFIAITDFFFGESSVLVFSLKSLFTATLMFSAACLLTNRIEVKR